MSSYNGWTIGVTPSPTGSGAWRARVRAWPRDASPQQQGGITLNFTESASSESAIVAAALTFARGYIDASTLERNADPRTAPDPRQGRTVVSEHKGWTVRITPSVIAADTPVWRAGVAVWPPDRDPQRQSGIQVRFTDVASDEDTIVQSALRSARHYIDASRTRHE
jgi:hypothetical protein